MEQDTYIAPEESFYYSKGRAWFLIAVSVVIVLLTVSIIILLITSGKRDFHFISKDVPFYFSIIFLFVVSPLVLYRLMQQVLDNSRQLAVTKDGIYVKDIFYSWGSVTDVVVYSFKSTMFLTLTHDSVTEKVELNSLKDFSRIFSLMEKYNPDNKQHLGSSSKVFSNAVAIILVVVMFYIISLGVYKMM